MATLADIGRAAGVSPATVSAVLHPHRQTTRVSAAVAERVRTLAALMGHAPNQAARALRRGRSDTIAVAIAAYAAPILDDPYYAALLAGIELGVRVAGRHLQLVGPAGPGGSDAPSAVSRVRDGLAARRFDAVIQLCGQAQELDTPGAPVVAFDQDLVHLPVVRWDEQAALELALGHLAELGHRSILWLGPESDGGRGARCAERAWARGLAGDACRFAHTGDSLADARAALTPRIAERRWTAVIAFNDRTALGAQQALIAAGVRIGSEVSVIGFDDLEARFGAPPITSVSHRLHDMGRQAAAIAIDLADGRQPAERVFTLKPELIVRASTSTPGALP